jgi:hypothetical protein
VSLAGAAKKLVDVAKGAGDSQEALDNNAAALGVSALIFARVTFAN